MQQKSKKTPGNKTLVVLINIFFFLSFFPFVSLYPIGSDVQPMIFVLAILIVLFLSYKNRLLFDKTDLFFISIAALSFVYFVNIESEFDIRKRVGLLLAFFVYYLTKRFHVYFKFKVFYWAVIVNFACGMFHLLLPNLFATTLGQFVRTIKILNFTGPRGISGLSSEPGFFGAMCVFFLALLLYFSKREPIRKRDIYTIVFMAVSLIVLTKSGTGYVFLMVFVMFWCAERFKIKNVFIFLILGIGVSLFLYQYSHSFSGRGYAILHILFTNPFAILSDTSVGMRLSNVYIATWNLFEHPLGSGIGTYSLVASEAYSLSDVGTLINTGRDVYTGNVSSFSQYVVEMGLFFVIFIIHVFYKGSKSLFAISLRTLAFLFISVSFSILFPPTWVLLGIVHKFKTIPVAKHVGKRSVFLKMGKSRRTRRFSMAKH